MKILFTTLLLGTVLGGCDAKNEEAPVAAPAVQSASQQAVQLTTATGYGKTHEDAYQEAVSQAVSQICGVEVAKAVVGARGLSKHPTTDDKGVVGGAAFNGVVRKCRVTEEERMKDGSFRVTVEAEICPPADIFAKRLAVTLPSREAWARALSAGNLGGELVIDLAGRCDTLLQEALDEDKDFVLLDRSSAADDAERAVAGQDSSRKEERAKTTGVKAADFVVEVSVSKADAACTERYFSVAERTKYECTIEIAYALKVIDVTTGGIVATQRGEARGSATAWHEGNFVSKAVGDTEAALRRDLPSAMQKLLSECKAVTNNH